MSSKSVKKTIVGIQTTTKHYKLEDDPAPVDVGGERNLIIDSIEARRDGLLGINKGMDNEASFLVNYVDPEDKNFKLIKVIPSNYVSRIDVVEILEEKDDDVEEYLQPRR